MPASLSALRLRPPGFGPFARAKASEPVALPPIPPPTITPADLVTCFESLGDNCEFGLVQRYCGVEPLGLFRFSLSRLESIIAAITADLKPLGTDADLDLVSLYGDDEIQGRSRHYDDFVYHTEVFAKDCDMDALRGREVKKLAYLRRRFLDGLRSGEKILVRKGGRFEDTIALAGILRGLGPNAILWVEGLERGYGPGAVEVAGNGLYRGHVERLASHRDVPSLDLRGWLELCLEALRVIRGTRFVLAANAVVQTDETWTFEALCTGRPARDERRFLGRPVYELSLADDTVRENAVVANRYIETPVPERSLVSFSVWMFIPASFQGAFVDVYFPFSESGHLHMADLSVRDTWQRVWACTRLPKGQINAMAAIRVTGRKGDTIYLSTWRFEDGCLPNDWIVLDPTNPSPAA